MASELIAGRYRFEQRLGGGMSEVWAAADLDLDRMVAVKVLAPNADPVRFEREARAVAALAHPNICRLYSYGSTGGRPFMVLEYLSGGSLEDRLTAAEPLADEEAGRIAVEIAAGLAHAHARSVVHRDLKPSNILFDAQGRAKIADFGIALLGGQSGLTAAGTVFGTAAYLSPEQAAGEQATPASDVYAFGVILFRMLTGRLPFEASDALTVAALHREQPPLAVAALRSDAPARLESITAAALAKSPRDRPPDGAALLAELADGGRPSVADTTVTHVLPPRRRRFRMAVLLLAVALLAAAGLAVAIAVTVQGRSAPKGTTTTSRPSSSAPSAPAVVTSPPETTREQSTSEPTTTVTSPVPATSLPTTTESPTVSPPPSTTPSAATTEALPPPTPPATTVAPPATTSETVPTDTLATTATESTTATTAEPPPPAPG